jgi:hypothetical protein
MPFITRARDFVNNPQPNHHLHPRFDVMIDSVQYLLDHAIGIENAIPTDEIITFLQGREHDIDRETWQIEVLGYLRVNRIFIGSTGRRGMFLIRDETDAREAWNFIHNRIDSETQRLVILQGLIEEAGWSV